MKEFRVRANMLWRFCSSQVFIQVSPTAAPQMMKEQELVMKRRNVERLQSCLSSRTGAGTMVPAGLRCNCHLPLYATLNTPPALPLILNTLFSFRTDGRL